MSTETHCSRTKCKSEFSLLNRKHHCRLCGKAFCNPCSDNWLDNKHLKTSKFYNVNDMIYSKSRVCKSCYGTFLGTQIIIYGLIASFILYIIKRII